MKDNSKKSILFRQKNNPAKVVSNISLTNHSYQRNSIHNENQKLNTYEYTNLENNEKEEIKMLDKWFNDFQSQTRR